MQTLMNRTSVVGRPQWTDFIKIDGQEGADESGYIVDEQVRSYLGCEPHEKVIDTEDYEIEHGSTLKLLKFLKVCTKEDVRRRGGGGAEEPS